MAAARAPRTMGAETRAAERYGRAERAMACLARWQEMHRPSHVCSGASLEGFWAHQSTWSGPANISEILSGFAPTGFSQTTALTTVHTPRRYRPAFLRLKPISRGRRFRKGHLQNRYLAKHHRALLVDDASWLLGHADGGGNAYSNPSVRGGKASARLTRPGSLPSANRDLGSPSQGEPRKEWVRRSRRTTRVALYRPAGGCVARAT